VREDAPGLDHGALRSAGWEGRGMGQWRDERVTGGAATFVKQILNP
jgi:hypothetical protein